MRRVLPLEHRLVEFVARNMRPEDRREIGSMTDRDLADFCVAGTLSSSFGAVIACPDGAPASVLCVHQSTPFVFIASMFATERWPDVALTATKYARRTLIPEVLRRKAHRVEARSIEGHREAHRWLEFLGARRVCALPGAGRNWETFYLYAWEPDDPRWRPYSEANGFPAPID